MRASFNLWPIVIVAAIWGAIAWAGSQGAADWPLLGVGGVVASVLVALVEIVRRSMTSQRFRQNGASNDGGAYGAFGADSGQGHAGPSSGGHASSGNGGGGSDGGGGSSGGDGGGGGGGD